MNKKMIKIAGWALGLSMAVAGIGAVAGVSSRGSGARSNAVTLAADKECSLDITISNFSEITTSYSTEYTHNYGAAESDLGSTFNVEAYGVYKNKDGIQMNSGKGTYIKNTTAFPGYITSIVCTWTATGKNSPTLYVSSGSVASASSTSLGKGSNKTIEQTYTITNPSTVNANYFYFDGTTVTGACYLSNLRINYTIPDTISPSLYASDNGDLLVTGSPKQIDLSGINFGNEEIVYSITSTPDAAVATASVSDNTLTISPVAVGATSVTVKGDSESFSASIAIEINVNNPSYTRVINNLNSLKVGSYVTFANPTKSVAISKTVYSGYRESEAVSISDGSFVPSADVAIFKLGLGTTKDTYTFYEEYVPTGGYLYTPGSSYGLGTQAELDGNAMFSIGTPTSSGLVDIYSSAANHQYLKVYTKNSVSYFEGSTSSNTNAAIYQYDCGEALTNSAITVTGTATKTSYVAGETFSATGATVTATLAGVNYDVTNWVEWPILHAGDTDVTGSLTIFGQTASVVYDGITVDYKPTENVTLNATSHTLYKNDSVQLTASVEDEYAKPVVSWLSSDSTVASVDSNGLVSSYSKSGNTTITAFSDEDNDGELDGEEKSATCEITVIAEQQLVLDKTSINAFTGDSAKTISVTSMNNFAPDPIVTWETSDSDVATVSGDKDGATVTIVGPGSANITLCVKDDEGDVGKTATCVVTVAQSQVDDVALTPSIVGDIYVGETLTLTPSVSVSGNATKTINWASDNEEIATVSASSTSNENPITVTPISAGSVTITATSAFAGGDPVVVEYDVVVKEDNMTLNWGSRGSQIFTVGEKFALKSGATLASSYENPRHSGAPLSLSSDGVEVLLGGEVIDASSYTFAKADSGKSLAIRYTDASSKVSTTTVETIKIVRSVVDSGTSNGSIGLNGAGNDIVYDGEAGAGSIGSKSNLYYDENGYVRLGNSNSSGSFKLTLSDATASISQVKVTVKSYGSDGTVAVGVTGASSQNATGSESTLTFDIPKEEQSSSFTISSPGGSKKRLLISEVVFTTSVSVDKSQSVEAIALDDFIDDNMHMDYTENLGYCKDGEHHYYSTAKTAFNALSDEARALFVSNSAYEAEYARLQAWADANGDQFGTDAQDHENTLIAKAANPSIKTGNLINFESNPAMVAVISVGFVALCGAFFISRRRKED